MARNNKTDPSSTLGQNQRQRDGSGASARTSRTGGGTAHSTAAEVERMTAIFDNALVGIAQTDLEGRFTFVNRQYCAIVGRSTNELMRMRLQDLTLQDENSGYGDSLETLVGETQHSVVEKRYVAPDGTEIWVNHGISFAREESGKPRFAVVVAQDITSRKRREEDLRQREETLRQQAEELEQQLIASGRLVSLGELTASMAHEFNNPLGIILGFTEDIMSDMDSADPNYRSMQIIDEEARRCEKIVKDLLEFARPRSVEFTWTDVAEVIKKTMEMISSRLFKQKVEATCDVAPDLPTIHADAQQLQQVLANLCLNALDAMPDGGNLTITARQETDDQLTISVTDTGFGIDHDTRDKIFKPFFTAKKRKGLGLGLPISERIVKAHGGSIRVESEPDQGATFRIRLPVKTAAQREASSAS